jgi:hypothetical protein
MLDARIEIRNEAARGCGTRKVGGLYMVDFETDFSPCGKLPLAMPVCPTCCQGIKPARQFVWIDADAILAPAVEAECQNPDCSKGCPLSNASNKFGRAGLLWVGEKFYPTPADFMMEASAQGISRRVNFVPRGFEIGKSWVLLGHIRAAGPKTPGIFTMFRPKAIDIVCDGSEGEKEIDDYISRGITPVTLGSSASAAGPEAPESLW